MADKKRPNVVGKGPALCKEMMEVFAEIAAGANGMSDDAKEKVVAPLEAKAAELKPILKMAYLKTVKAGEVAWDLKEKAVALKETVAGGDEAAAIAAAEEMVPEVDQLIHKIKTFVVRMT